MSEKRLVWDLPVRLFHWILVLSLLASWYTAEMASKGEFTPAWLGPTLGQRGYAQVHFWLGFWALGLVIFRLIWGFVGPRHARFSSMFKGPGHLLNYASKFHRRDSEPTAGHNPMGAMVVLLMLLMIGAQAVAGLFLIDNTEIFPAPFHAVVSESLANKLMHFHHINFAVLQAVVSLHVLAVLFYQFYKRQNLIGPMVTGYKPAELIEEGEAIKSSQMWKALFVALVAGAIVWLVLSQAPPPADLEF